MIWQVVGRVYLSRPYGVSGAVSSASQLLELSIFMLANILVALACLLGAGLRLIPPEQRKWLYIAMAFVPALLLLLHPAVFYGLLNKLLAKMKKPLVVQRLPKRQLLVVLLWTVVGLLWQSLAVWLLTRSTLHLPIGKWYVLAGAYCLAWTIGFSVGFLSPGGMGVREMVFITTMQFLLPQGWVARNLHLDDRVVFVAFLGFLGVLLRLWAIAGELTFATITYRGPSGGERAGGCTRAGGGGEWGYGRADDVGGLAGRGWRAGKTVVKYITRRAAIHRAMIRSLSDEQKARAGLERLMRRLRRPAVDRLRQRAGGLLFHDLHSMRYPSSNAVAKSNTLRKSSSVSSSVLDIQPLSTIAKTIRPKSSVRVMPQRRRTAGASRPVH